jgi:hypothetical protein
MFSPAIFLSICILPLASLLIIYVEQEWSSASCQKRQLKKQNKEMEEIMERLRRNYQAS